MRDPTGPSRRPPFTLHHVPVLRSEGADARCARGRRNNSSRNRGGLDPYRSFFLVCPTTGHSPSPSSILLGPDRRSRRRLVTLKSTNLGRPFGDPTTPGRLGKFILDACPVCPCPGHSSTGSGRTTARKRRDPSPI